MSAAVLLATEGRRFTPTAVARAAELARVQDGPVRVLAVGRVHGTSFGFPNPGLMPTRAELEQLTDHVDEAIRALERKGVAADGQILATRNGAKRIVREADRLGCVAIVMAADPARHPVVRNFLWSQEPQRVLRRGGARVQLVEE